MSDEVGEFLEHHGIKGMHWGRHKSGDSGGSSSSGSKGAKEVSKGDVARAVDAKAEKTAKAPKQKYTSQQIKDARIRENARINKISQHADDLNLQTSDKGRAAAAKIYEKSVNEYINSSDGPVAAKMTKGEKITAAFGVAIMGAAMASLVVH